VSDDDLEQRLRRLGEAPLDPQIEAAHRLAIAEVVGHGGGSHRWRFGWKAIAAAAIAGFLAGSTGLAAAGTLPNPAQDVAHEVLGAVGINVPRSTLGCPEGTVYRNHGEYVAAVEAAGGDVEAAAHSDCGMPQRGNRDGNSNRGTPRPDTDGDPCTGPPAWAGAHLTREEREAAKAERRSRCGASEAPQTEAPETEAPEAQEQPEAPATGDETTTTSTPETTSTVIEETTTTTTAG
jgi:hypothetical protein